MTYVGRSILVRVANKTNEVLTEKPSNVDVALCPQAVFVVTRTDHFDDFRSLRRKDHVGEPGAMLADDDRCLRKQSDLCFEL
jgi:hypothetical protein